MYWLHHVTSHCSDDHHTSIITHTERVKEKHITTLVLCSRRRAVGEFSRPWGCGNEGGSDTDYHPPPLWRQSDPRASRELRYLRTTQPWIKERQSCTGVWRQRWWHLQRRGKRHVTTQLDRWAEHCNNPLHSHRPSQAHWGSKSQSLQQSALVYVRRLSLGKHLFGDGCEISKLLLFNLGHKLCIKLVWRFQIFAQFSWNGLKIASTSLPVSNCVSRTAALNSRQVKLEIR